MLSGLPRILSRPAQLCFSSFFAGTVPRTGWAGCTQTHSHRARHGFPATHHSAPELRGTELLRNPHTNKVADVLYEGQKHFFFGGGEIIT